MIEIIFSILGGFIIGMIITACIGCNLVKDEPSPSKKRN